MFVYNLNFSQFQLFIGIIHINYPRMKLFVYLLENSVTTMLSRALILSLILSSRQPLWGEKIRPVHLVSSLPPMLLSKYLMPIYHDSLRVFSDFKKKSNKAFGIK